VNLQPLIAPTDQNGVRVLIGVFVLWLLSLPLTGDVPTEISVRVTALGLLAACPLALKAIERRGVLLDAIGVFSVTYFVNYGVSALLHESYVVAGVDLIDALPGALDFAILGLACYYVGYWTPLGKDLSRHLPAPWDRVDVAQVQKFALVCLALTLLHRVAMAFSLGWFVTFLGGFDWVTMGVVTVLAYGHNPPPAGIGSRKWHAWLLLALAVSQGFVSGFRGLFILPIVVFFVSLYFARSRFPWRGFATFVVIAFTVILPVTSFYKTARQGEELPIADSIRYTAERIGEVDLGEYLLDTAQELGRRYGVTPIFAVVLEKTGSEVPFQAGATYENMLVSFVPRLLWPDKPILADYAVNYLPWMYGILGEDDERTAVGFGFMGEAYVNFGTSGVIGLMLILGFLSRLLNDWLLARPHVNAIDAGIFLPVFWVVANQESTLVVGLTGLAKFIVIVVGITALLLRHARRHSPP
jgi:hypothetical protein